MSWEEYTFEDPIESYDRCQEDEGYFGAEYKATFLPKPRKCIKCKHTFNSKYPCKCPECGGWTEEE